MFAPGVLKYMGDCCTSHPEIYMPQTISTGKHGSYLYISKAISTMLGSSEVELLAIEKGLILIRAIPAELVE